MSNLNKIVEELSKLTVVEAAELSKQLEEKWGVTAAAPVAAAETNYWITRHLAGLHEGENLK